MSEKFPPSRTSFSLFRGAYIPSTSCSVICFFASRLYQESMASVMAVNVTGGTIWSMSYSDGWIIVGTGDRQGHVFDVENLSTPIATITRGFQKTVFGTAFQGDQMCFACGSGTVFVYSRAALQRKRLGHAGTLNYNDEPMFSWSPHTKDINNMRFIA